MKVRELQFQKNAFKGWRQGLRRAFLPALVAFSVALSACSGGLTSQTGPRSSQYLARQNKDKVKAQQEMAQVWKPTAQNSFPDAMNPAVQKWIGIFQGNLKVNFDRWVMRLGKYGPTIDKILDEEGAPRDLIYLAMIESGFNLTAKSTASANGPWQFISSTGKMYGLHNDFFVDDRHDLEEATRAAARHLKDLYNVYGDWYLAFAAYNAGPGKVNGAIRKAGTKDYWRLSSARSRVLRQETKDYVPKILAARHIVKNYKRYGYNDKSFAQPMEFDRVTVPDATDINVLANCSQSTPEILKELNPDLVRGLTPPGQSYEVHIPKGTKETFLANYAQVPSDRRVSLLEYKAGRGETINTIAKKYKINATELAKANDISPKSKLSTGQRLVIPATRSTLVAMATVNTESHSSSSSKTKTMTYKVRPGDSLSKIAKRQGVSEAKLASWNKLRKNARLKVGQSLVYYKKGKDSGQVLAYQEPVITGSGGSGVANIILKEQENPVVLEAPKAPKNSQTGESKIPVMIASAPNPETVELAQVDAPAMVKGLDGTVQFDESVPEDVVAELTPEPAPPTVAIAGPQMGENETRTLSKSATRPDIYKVKAGDSLGAIAKRYGMSVSELKTSNRLKNNNIRVGQSLTLKPGALGSGSSVAKAKGNVMYHKVASGETLWSVSRKYGVSVDDLKKWNNLSKNAVQANQKLKINKSNARL